MTFAPRAVRAPILAKGPLVFCMLLALFAGAPTARAKDLSNRLGVGYKNQSTVDLPSVAVQYYPSADLGFSASLGVDTQKDSSRFGFGAKVYKVVFSEDNLNFYMGAGAGVISQEHPGLSNESGFELSGFGGAEFFLPGLENLGFSFEAGAGIASVSSGVRFRTFGDSPLRAGMIFIFNEREEFRMGKRVITTKAAPAPVGPYSQAVEVNGLIFCSGQISIEPATDQVKLGGVQEQTELVLKNVEGLLGAAGLGFKDVVKTTIFLLDMADFAAVNEIYATRFGKEPPARSTVAVAGLPKGVRVEIEVIAARP